MSFWLHCNACYKVPYDRCVFFLTSCGHIFCVKCEQRGWRQKCLLCETVKPTAIPLTNQIPANVQLFVGDPVAMLRKNSSSSARQIATTLEWQSAHRKRYLNHLMCKIHNYEGYTAKLKEEFKKFLAGKEKEQQSKMEELRSAAVARLEKQERDFQGTLEAMKREAQHQLEEQRKGFQDLEVLKREAQQAQRWLEQQRKEFQDYARDFQNRLEQQWRDRFEQQRKEYQESFKTLEKEYVKVLDENTYLKRLLGQKSSPARMSPSGDRGRPSSSPTMKGLPGSSPNSSLHSSGRSLQDGHHNQHSSHRSGYKASPSSVSHYQVSPDTTTAQNRISSSNSAYFQISPSSNIICGRVVSKTPPSGGSHPTPTAVSNQNVPSIDERLKNLQRISPGQASHHSSQEIKTPQSAITSGRVSMRTPPSGGRLGYIASVAMPSLSTPSPQFRHKTPKSVPHPMNF